MEDFLDHLANLTAQGHAEAARALAAPHEADDPLRYHLGLASVAAALSDLDALREHATAAAALAPDEPLVLQARAMAALLAGEGTAAVALGSQALELDGSPRSYRGLANISLQLGQLEAAERTLRELIARAPSDAYGLKQLGRVRAMRGDEGGALGYLARAFAADPTDLEPLELAITMYRDAGWAIGALTLSRVTRQGIHPPEVNVLLDLMALVLMERIAPNTPGREAFDATMEAVSGLVSESATLSPMAQLRVIRALLDAERVSEALAMIERVASRVDGPLERAELEHVRGLALERAGEPAEALAAYEAAVAADPGAWEAACNAVPLALADGDLGRAGEILARVPDSLKRLRPQLLFNEAVWLERSGRHDEALAHAAFLRDSVPGVMDELIDALFEGEEGQG